MEGNITTVSYECEFPCTLTEKSVQVIFPHLRNRKKTLFIFTLIYYCLNIFEIKSKIVKFGESQILYENGQKYVSIVHL